MQGIMTLSLAIYSYTGSTGALIRSVTGLMRNLCVDDIHKNTLVSDDTLLALIGRVADSKHSDDYTFLENAYACFAAMSLRNPHNAYKIYEHGAIVLMINGMTRHSKLQALLRQGCPTLRNIAARCVDLRTKLLDDGAENILRACGKFNDVVDEAYATLGDLGCDVTMVRINEDGTAEAAYEQFDANTGKLKFNPVFDESDDINNRIEDNAHASFAMIREDEDEYHDDDDELDDHTHRHEHGHVHDQNCSLVN
jgi:hypothetical protein